MSPILRFEQQVLASVRQQKLLNEQDRVLVAVSGGPDSVALLHLLCAWQSQLNLALHVIHMNHGLRGEESEADADFVQTLCQELDVPCNMQRLNLQLEIQTRKGQSIQSLARDLRYAAFTQVAHEHDLTKVALGHTSDDQAETVLMWMLRGAGSVGLSGMPAFRAPYFIRPLLGVLRVEIEAYLKKNQWPYRMDSSNASPKYRRNRIRQELMPVLKQFNPKIVQVLSRQAKILREESEYLDQVASKALASVMFKADADRVVLNQVTLSGLPRSIQRRVVLLLYRQVTQTDVHPPFDCVEAILDLVNRRTSGLVIQSHGIRVHRDYNEIHLCAVGGEAPFHQPSLHPVLPLSVPGSLCWPLTGRTLEACLVDRLPETWKNDPSCVYLDGDHFTHDLVVRQWKAGDSFYPLGMNGQKKKIQDFFSDIKLSRTRRSKVPLVVAPEGIVWVAGFRPDHRFRVMKDTKKFVALKASPEFSTQSPS